MAGRKYDPYTDHANATSVEEDAEDGRDPGGLREVSLEEFGGDVEANPESEPDDEAPAPNLTEAVAALGKLVGDVLTKEERFVLVQRQVGDAYATIAKNARPRISGPSQVRKIEQRAIKKLRVRLSNFQNDLKPKLDKPDL
jgi:DNA-directed RNA polymerase sigma subunit (sigma70/sigma32)